MFKLYCHDMGLKRLVSARAGSGRRIYVSALYMYEKHLGSRIPRLYLSSEFLDA